MTPPRWLFPPSRARLARMVAAELGAVGVEPGGTAYVEAEFGYRLPDGGRIFLGNLFRECALLWPWQRRARVRRFVQAFAQRAAAQETDFEQARTRLLPGVRDALILDFVRLQSLLDGQEPLGVPSRPLGSRLRLCLFLDAPESTATVTDGDLQAWGKTFEETLEIAFGNLEARSPGAFVRGEGVHVSPWSDCYDPARALLRTRLAALDLEGDAVAFMPNWNRLIVAGSEDVAGLAGALAYARRVVEEEPRGMSALPLVWRGGQWIDLELPHGHALEAELRKTRVLELVRVYEDQTDQLQKHLEQAGLDVFVAAYTGTRREEGDQYSSYSVWAKGVDTLLPRTESISFFDPEAGPEGKVVAHVDWDLVGLHCGALLQPTDWAQQRYRVEAFPDAVQLEAMRASQAQREAGRRASR